MRVKPKPAVGPSGLEIGETLNNDRNVCVGGHLRRASVQEQFWKKAPTIRMEDRACACRVEIRDGRKQAGLNAGMVEHLR